METALGLAAIAALIRANGWFVLGEFAFVATRRPHLEEAAERGDRRAQRALDVLRRLCALGHRSLSLGGRAGRRGLPYRKIYDLSYDATLRGFEQTLAKYQESAGNNFDFADARLAIDELSAALRDFDEFTRDVAITSAGSEPVRRANAAIRSRSGSRKSGTGGPGSTLNDS